MTGFFLDTIEHIRPSAAIAKARGDCGPPEDSRGRTYHSPRTCGLAPPDRMVGRFPRRVTTALRTGSDAADIIGFPPFRITVDTDDVTHSLRWLNPLCTL